MPVRNRSDAAAGASFLVTHVTSVAAVALYGTLHDDPAAALQEGLGHGVTAGALLDVVLALAVVATAVLLHPRLSRHSPTGAAGYLALRTLEAAVILTGAGALLAAVALAGPGTTAGDHPGALALVEVYRAAFVIGPGLVCGAGNTVVLALTLLRTGLVPRWIPVLGLVGAALVTASNLGILTGVHAQTAPTAVLAALPIFAWEVSLALRLLVTGLRDPGPTPVGPVAEAPGRA